MTTEKKAAIAPPGREQRAWIRVQWIGTFGSFFLLVQAVGIVIARGPANFAGLAASALSSVAAVIALIWVRRLSRRGVRDVAFIKGTTTARLIAVAWVLVLLAIVSGTVVGVVWDVDAESLDWTAGVVGVLGTASLIAVLGPGYAEYREAYKQVEAEREHAG